MRFSRMKLFSLWPILVLKIHFKNNTDCTYAIFLVSWKNIERKNIEREKYRKGKCGKHNLY